PPHGSISVRSASIPEMPKRDPRSQSWHAGQSERMLDKPGDRPIRIGVNALYMLPGEVGGTEIYLREILAALGRLDTINEYFIFVNAETREFPLEVAPSFHCLPQNVRARTRSARILWEQT